MTTVTPDTWLRCGECGEVYQDAYAAGLNDATLAPAECPQCGDEANQHLRDSGLRYGSVCSGIEAASTAWEPLGWSPAWFSEIEPFPSAVLAHHWPDVPNLGDMLALPGRVDAGEIEAPDVLVGGTPCFTAGHMVLTESGYRPIEALLPGDRVVTHKGRLQPVLRVGSKLADVGRWKAVGASDGLVCTSGHPFLIADDLSMSTRVNNVPVRIPGVGPLRWAGAAESIGSFWAALTAADIETPDIPRPFGLSRRDTLHLIGWWLGDGWIRDCTETKRALILGLSTVKLRAFQARFPSLAQTPAKMRTTCRLTLGCSEFCNWLEAAFGSGAAGKTLPAWVLADPDRDALLAGYCATDGHTTSAGVTTINSVSQTLARGAAALAQTLGYAATVTKIVTPDKTLIEGRTVNQRDYFACRMYPLEISRKSRLHEGYLMRKIQSFAPLGQAEVFNIEVADDHSYVVNGVVVHNCQAFSVAGNRESLADARGGMTLAYVELADAIDRQRARRGEQPGIIVWENVPGVLSTKDNAFGCFLAGLAGEDAPLLPPGKRWTNAGVVLGPKRAVAWRILDAQYFGLAQRRRRVFVVASARDGFDPSAVLLEFDGLRRDSPPRRETEQSLTHDVAPSLVSSGQGVERTGETRRQDPVVGCFWNGEQVTQTLDAVLHKGQTMPEKNRFPAVLQPVPILEPGARTGKSTTDVRAGLGVGEAGDPMFTLQAGKQHGVAAMAFQERGRTDGRSLEVNGDLAYALTSPAGGGRAQERNVCVSVTGDIAHTLNTANNGKGCSEDGTGRGVPTIAFSSKDYGADATEGLSPTLRAGGHADSHANAGVPPAVTVALRGREGGGTAEVGGEVATALRASSGGGGDKPHVLAYDTTNITSPQNGMNPKPGDPCFTLASGQHPPLLTGMAVRRLTPAECEALQGFPRRHTQVPYRNKPAADGPRYKALGNSMAVPCMRWIGRRIERHLKGEI